MKIMKSHLSFSALILILAGTLFSCELSDSANDYSITPMVLCNSGTTSNNFTVEYFIDNEFIISDTQESTESTQSELPLGKKEKVTITATKEDETSSLSIVIYKDNKIDKFSNLASCTSSSYTSCSNTLVLYYDVEDESNLTKTASSDTDSDSTTTDSGSDSSE